MGERREKRETFPGLEEAAPLRGFEDDDLAPGVALQLSGMMLRIAELEGMLSEMTGFRNTLRAEIDGMANIKPVRRRWGDTKRARDAVNMKDSFDEINKISGVHESSAIIRIWSHYLEADRLVRALDVFFQGGD